MLLFLDHAFDSRLGWDSRVELLAWPASSGRGAGCCYTSRWPGGVTGAPARACPSHRPSEPLARSRCLYSLARTSRPASKSRWGQTRLPCLPPRPQQPLPPPPQPPPPPPGRAGLGSSEPSGGLGTGPGSSVPPRCVAGCGFIILIDSSCSPTPWGPRPAKGGRGGICGPLHRPSPPAALRAAGPSVPCCGQANEGGQGQPLPPWWAETLQGGAELCPAGFGAVAQGARRGP